MKKKFITLLLAICMILPCVFMLNACGEKGGNEILHWNIIKDEWENVISTENFSIEATPEMLQNLQNHDLISLTYDYDKDNGEIKITEITKYSGYDGTIKRHYLTILGETNQYYEARTYDISNPTFPDDYRETTYDPNNHVENYIDLIEDVKNNYDKFESDSESERYTRRITSNAFGANNILNEISVLRFEDGITLICSINDKEWYITFDNPLEQAYENTKTFYIKGGPSKTDVDYAEYYFDGDNGFRIYSPNNPIANRTDGYYKRNDDGTYTMYTKQDDGSWALNQTNGSNFASVVNATKSQYLGFMDHMNDLSVVETRDSELAPYIYGYNDGVDGVLQQVVGGFTYNYYDIKITAYFNYGQSIPYIGKITWKMKITQGNASSAVYDMEMLYEDSSSIVYPEVDN